MKKKPVRKRVKSLTYNGITFKETEITAVVLRRGTCTITIEQDDENSPKIQGFGPKAKQ